MHSPTPWSLMQRIPDNPRDVIVVDAEGAVVFETDWVPVPDEIDDYVFVINCVNSVSRAGRLDGDVPAQARAWQEVYKALWDAGMPSFLPDPIMGGGLEKAIQFIKYLKEKADANVPQM